MNETVMKTIKLRPKADARSIRFGQPWVFADQLVLDRRTRAIPAGEIVMLTDSEGQFLAHGAFNSNSKISFRVLSRGSDEQIDANWVAGKIQTALDLRQRLYTDDFYRLVHAEGDGLPGLIIDRFGDTAVVQPNAAWADVMIEDIANALNKLGMVNIYLNASGRARKLEGLDDVAKTLRGEVPEKIEVHMNGAKYIADLLGGQKTGLFYDQRDNHAFAAKLAKGGEVLDVFSHVGGFGLAMLGDGANSVTAIDGSAPALALAKEGADAMGAQNFETIKGDAFDQMQILIDEGRKFDVVICDPPAFAPNKASLSAGLRAYERVAKLGGELVKPSGYLGLCSCSHAASPEKFASSSMRGIGRAGRAGQVIHRGSAGADHPTHPYLDESGYLKSIFLRLS